MTLQSAKPTQDIGSLGHGEVIRREPRSQLSSHRKNMFTPLNIACFSRMPDTWPNKSTELKEQGLSVTGQLPVLEYEGKILSQHSPSFGSARELGEYDGDTRFEKYRVDSVAEIYNDWRTQWVKSLGNATDELKHDFVPNHYKTIEPLHAEEDGPYLLGLEVTYIDFAVYQYNDMQTGTLPASLPESLVKFRASFEARPRVAGYISRRA